MNANLRAARGVAALLGGALLLAAGCGSKATQVIVTIDAEPGVQAEAPRLHLVVLGGLGRTTAPTASRLDRLLVPGGRDPAYPFELALAPVDGDVGRSYSVTATAETGGDPATFVAQARIIGGYVEGETLRVRLVLEDSCRTVRCGDEQTCKAGVCVDAWTGGEVDAGVVDAGGVDFGMLEDGGHDGGPRDAGMHDLGDRDAATIDAGADAGGGACAGCAGPCSSGACVDVAEIAVGGYHSCARLADGTVRCWGTNGSGELGDGTAATSRITPVAVVGLTGAAELAMGYSHSCARLVDGTVRCWGANDAGQIGDGTFTGRPSLAVVSGLSGATAIAAGAAHTCAALTDGTVRCWGRDMFGQLGDGRVGATSATPVAVVGLGGAVEVGVGSNHSCARLTDGTVRCWGENRTAELGDGTLISPRLTPVPVSGLGGVVELASNLYDNCARLTDGTVRCWGGANGYGELGSGTTGSGPVPVAVSGLSGASGIATGTVHTCALLTDGTVRCWGYNGTGQLGDGTITDRRAPTVVSGLGTAVEVSAGQDHSCARLADGSVWCWGGNPHGELGDGTTTNRSMPVEVVW